MLRAIDKLDRLGSRACELLLGEGRKDESGDFTKGAGLSGRVRLSTRVLHFTGSGRGQSVATSAARARADGAREFRRWRDDVSSATGSKACAELREIGDAGRRPPATATASSVDPSVVRGLEYYTGPVYEAELTFAVTNDDGRPVRFGSVGGGGRYDGLVGRFRGEDVPATGFSIGVSRLVAALKAVSSPLVTRRDAAAARRRHRHG